LSGQVAGQPVQAHLWVDPATRQAVFATDHLPPAPAGKVYELWLIKGQTPVAIDLIPTDSGGRGLLIFTVPGSLADYQVVAITVQHAKLEICKGFAGSSLSRLYRSRSFGRLAGPWRHDRRSP